MCWSEENLWSSSVPTAAAMCGGRIAQAPSERKGPKDRWLICEVQKGDEGFRLYRVQVVDVGGTKRRFERRIEIADAVKMSNKGRRIVLSRAQRLVALSKVVQTYIVRNIHRLPVKP
jgi:hypothetical protein